MDVGSMAVAAVLVLLGLATSLAWVHSTVGASWTIPEWVLVPLALLGVGVFIGSEGWGGRATLAAMGAVVAAGAGLLGEPTSWVRSSLVVMGWAWIAYAALVWLGGTTPWGAMLCAVGSLGTGLLLRPARERGRATPAQAPQASYDEWGVSSPSESEASDW